MSSESDYLVFDKNRHLQISSIVPKLKDLPDSQIHVVGWGKLRMFLATLNFFNGYVETPSDSVDKTICVYAGAGPGNSIVPLLDFYHNVEYHLYDPLGFDQESLFKFSEKLHHKANVKLIPEPFTLELAKSWKDYIELNPRHRVYFISDIRNTNYPSKPKKGSMTEQEYSAKLEEVQELKERIIEEDMATQKEWVKTMRPHWSLLKFRPPLKHQMYNYLDGYISRGVYGDIDTLESFLIPSDNITEREYDVVQYKEVINYHNYVFRGFKFYNIFTSLPKPIAPGIYLYDDYDSTVFAHFIREYLNSYQRENEKISTILKIAEYVLNTLEPDENRRKKIMRRFKK